MSNAVKVIIGIIVFMAAAFLFMHFVLDIDVLGTLQAGINKLTDNLGFADNGSSNDWGDIIKTKSGSGS